MENRKHYTEVTTEEMVAETLRDMNNPGGYSDELAITVLQDMLKRPVEIWMRSKNGEDIETHPHFPVKRNSVLLWYKGTNTKGDDGRAGDHRKKRIQQARIPRATQSKQSCCRRASR